MARFCGCMNPRSDRKQINIYNTSDKDAIKMRGVVETASDLPTEAEDNDTYYVADEGLFLVAYNGEWLATSDSHPAWGSYDGSTVSTDDLADGGFFVSAKELNK